MLRPNPTAGYQGYQQDIKSFCTLDIMSGHPLADSLPPYEIQFLGRKKNQKCIGSRP